MTIDDLETFLAPARKRTPFRILDHQLCASATQNCDRARFCTALTHDTYGGIPLACEDSLFVNALPVV